MTCKIENQVPLHRCYSKQESMDRVKTRYRRLKEMLSRQLPILQNNSQFCEICQELYADGFKDWMILNAISSIMLNKILMENGITPGTELSENEFNSMSDDMKNRSYPAADFLDTDIKLHILFTAFSTLKIMGYEIRRDISPEKLMKFLRTRIAYFEDDLDHIQLFSPGGNWPNT